MEGFAATLGVREGSAGDGRSRLEFDAKEEHLNAAGTLHGGLLATLVDTAMGLAARSSSDDGETPATSQLSVTYLAAGATGPVLVTARVRKRGRHLLICEADAEQDGQPLVDAIATFTVLQTDWK